MRTHTLLVWLAASVAGSALAADAVPPDQLPGTVQTALAKQFPDLHAVKAERHDERNDYVYFTVTLQGGKTEKQVVLTENGEVIPLPH